jgi:transposase
MARQTRELTDAQWAKLEPLLPPQRPKTGRPNKNHRLVLEAIIWLDRTGAPWRTVASRFYRWRSQGVFDRLLAEAQRLADAAGKLDWLCHFVDGSVVRAHQHAAGARHQPTTQDRRGIAHAQDAAPGRSRGGLSTKLHLRTEGSGKPLVILATAGQRHEVTQLAGCWTTARSSGPAQTAAWDAVGRRRGRSPWPATRVMRIPARGPTCTSWYHCGHPDQVQPASPAGL